MTLTKTKKKISKINWYQQAADVKPFYISYPLKSCFSYKINNKKVPYQYNIVIFLQNNFMRAYLDKNNLKKASLYYYQRQLKNKNFLPNLYQKWQKEYVGPYLKLVNQILSSNLSKLSNQELINLFNEFNKAYTQVWDHSIFLDNFDYYGEIILQQVLNKENKNIATKDLEILLTPPQPSFIQQERLDLLRLACLTGRQAEKKSTSLLEHQQKYFWMHNNYATIKTLSQEYFRKNLASLNLAKEKELQKYLKTLTQKKERIIKKYNFSSRFVNTINFLSLLGNFRDSRKSYQQISSDPLKKIAQQFAIRTGSSLKTIENLFHWEIKELFNAPKKSLLQEAENRSLGAFYNYNKKINSYHLFTGKHSQKLDQQIQNQINQQGSLSGSSAYPGIVKGKVKIINGRKDFPKMNPGDILVAPNTRPEYVPLMKIAGAIISAEGGITCHSAIVSRELKIPCLVGVQSALSSLKDGQMVEVNATKGIITIL